jgi:O-methyltransferase domain/Dimerisation domain
LGLATAYQASQALIVAVKLGIPDLLAGRARGSADLAQETGTQPDRMHRLLRALAAFDVVKDLGEGEFELAPSGDFLRSDAPNSVRPLVLMYGSDIFSRTAVSLGECVRTGKNAFQLLHGMGDIFDCLEKDRELAHVFDGAMSGRSALTGLAVARAYDFRNIKHLVDVAGGQGKMLASVLKSHPHLHGTLYDLPRVANGASEFLAQEGIADRCQVVSGDVFTSVPAGGDLYLLSRVIHDWDDLRATEILRSCRRAMAADARLLVLDRVVPEQIQPGPMSQSHAMLDLTMMLWTAGGRERTAREFAAMIKPAGLRLARIISMSIPDSLLELTPA